MATVNGDNGDNVLIGTEEDDIINGFDGNDVIDSVDRPSDIFTGPIEPRRDVVDAGAGNDFVTGGKLDRLDGGSGNDFLSLNFNFNGPVAGSAPAVSLVLDATGSGTASDGTFITGFETVSLNGTDNGDDVFNTGNVRGFLNGGGGNDVLTTGSADDVVSGGDGNDTISTGGGADVINGGSGDDVIDGGDGDDSLSFNLLTDGSDRVNLGSGNDMVRFDRFDGGTGNVRITFTSAEVGNGNPDDTNTVANQDGGLAVRVQSEDASGVLTGPVLRFDDEGIMFLAGTQGITMDVRDLVSGVARGDTFEGVVLGTNGADNLTFFPPFRAGQNFYYNAGMGDDVVVAGTGNDFLVGGGGNDSLSGNEGNDSFIGGAGNDVLLGGSGTDTVTMTVATDGADAIDLGDGSDVVVVNNSTAGQVRLTFTSAEVGNGNVNDSNTMMNQDGGLAVRLQLEDSSDGLTGPVTRTDDEGITFVGGTGVTFDVRDLVSDVQRGDLFEVVVLGTMGGDTLTAIQPNRSYYYNGGMGDDDIAGGSANDFLVGGAGNDRLEGGAGDDRFIGGAGRDRFVYSPSTEIGNDTIIDFSKVDLFLSDIRLRDTNNDRIVTFGPNNVLDLRGGTVEFTAIDPMIGLRLLGQLADGDFAYADASTLLSGMTEGSLANDVLNGASGGRTFFFDTALGLDFGDDRINGFGSDDRIVTTSAIVDSNNDGTIDFGSDRTLDLAGGTTIRINAGGVRALEFDGSIIRNGVEYFVYSRIGSTGTGTEDLAA